MDNFIYNTPTMVYFGKDTELQVGEILSKYNPKMVLFHYGKESIKKIGLYDKVVKALKDAKIKYIELGGVEANPKLSLVEKGISLAKKNNVDFILAVGGGSVIDSAKAIADGFYVSHSPWLFSIGERKPQKALPIGVILTISASGSEMSNSCVITNDYTNDKRGFCCELNRPRFAILNPELTYSVSKYQTACGITDILMHTLERVISSPDILNPLTDNLAYGLIKSVIEAGRKAILNPTDYEARATLMWASSLSHNGITACGRPYIMSVHQIEHAVSGLFDNVSHGAGLAALWPAWARLASLKNHSRFASLGYNVFALDPNLSEAYVAKEAIDKIEAYFEEISIPHHLRDFGIAKEDLPKIAQLYTFDGKRAINDIIYIDYDKCLEILNLAY